MVRKKQHAAKKQEILEVAVSDVFVVNGAKYRPFIEQFCHTGVNFTQKDLGTIMGFFIVRDTSAMSENIVNFLVSEIKKYYFSPSQKTPEEKFEATLHRVNRMLEELATIGNVNWLGTIDGAVCAVTGTTACFSVTGAASIFLLRDDHLIDISDGLASEEAAHNPLKTFADISTGALLPYDKLIITSSELLELVTFDELQKNAIRMGQKNFVQHVQTVLTNQCTIAVTLIADLYPQEEKKTPTVAPVAELPTNFFGALPPVVSDEPSPAAPADTPDDSLHATDLAPHMTDTTSKEDYVDPQTGHIYMQGSDTPPEKPSVIDDLSNTASDLLDSFKVAATRRKRWLGRRLTHLKKTATADTVSPYNDAPAGASAVTSVAGDAHTMPAPRPSATITLTEMEETPHPPTTVRTPLKTLTTQTLFRMRCIGERCIFTVRTHHRKIRSRFMAKKHSPAHTQSHTAMAPSETYLQSKKLETTSLHSVLPRFSRIRHLWHAFSLRSKILAAGIVLCIVIAPLIFSAVRTRITSQPAQQPAQPTAPAVPSEPEESDPPLATLLTVDAGKTVVQLKDNLVAVGAHTITFFDGTTAKQPLTVPDDAGAIVTAAAMDDLNMIFFLTDKNTLYSISPVDGKFTAQPNIPAWNAAQTAALVTYMTYLYRLDGNGITRHTRIDGGFDAGKSWLKDSFDTTVASMAIDENIYLANGTEAAAFFSGRKTPFTLDNRIAHPSLLFATPRTRALWIIDTDAAHLYSVDKKTGAVQSDIAHTDLGTTTSFIVNESASTAILLTGGTVKTLPLTEHAQ